MFLKQCWYAAAWTQEMAEGAMLARTIAEEPLLLWQGGAGEFHALQDRCPHRYAPLSLGKQVDGGVQCGYHGLVFDGAGRCIDNPHGPIVSALQVRSYPVQARHKIVWVWMGRTDAADPALIPDLAFADRAPDTAYSSGYLPTRANQQLISDNILDLTHADYLHADSLGGGSITRTKPSIEELEDGKIFIEWLSENEQPPPFFRDELPDPDALADIWTSVLWHPCGVMTLRFGATVAGAPREDGIDTWSAHIVTPETSRTTHYFYFNTREYRTGDAEYNAHFAAGLRHAFTTQDKPMIEAQQARIGEGDLFDHKPALLRSDAASTRARHVYQKMLAAEQSALSGIA